MVALDPAAKQPSGAPLMLIVIRLVAFALFLLPVAAIAQQLTVSGLTFPDSVSGFARGPVQDYEKTHPGLGQSVAYERGPWRADVYVYDLRRSSIPDDPHSEAIRQQLLQAKLDVYRAQQRGAWQKAELYRSFTLPEHGVQRFSCASFTLVSPVNVEVDSTLCVTGSKNKFVKFRVTGPHRGAAEPMQFIEAFGPLLWPGA
jgi:hypothetical protein